MYDYVMAHVVHLMCLLMIIHRCRKWVQNCRRADLLGKSAQYLYNNCLLCSDHFEDGQFMNSQIKNSLVWNAVPTLFKVPNPPSFVFRVYTKRAQPKPHAEPPVKKQKGDSSKYLIH